MHCKSKITVASKGSLKTNKMGFIAFGFKLLQYSLSGVSDIMLKLGFLGFEAFFYEYMYCTDSFSLLI